MKKENHKRNKISFVTSIKSTRFMILVLYQPTFGRLPVLVKEATGGGGVLLKFQVASGTMYKEIDTKKSVYTEIDFKKIPVWTNILKNILCTDN